MEGRTPGVSAGILLCGVLVAVVSERELLAEGAYLMFIGTVLGAAFCLWLAFCAGVAVYQVFFTKREETLGNCLLFWACFCLVIGAIVWVGFVR